MEGTKKLKNVIRENKESDALDILRSLRRAGKNIRDYALMNNFDLFVTFTFSPEIVDRYDIDACRIKASNWFKNIQKRNGKFQYLAVLELHKDGALHIHALLKNYTGKVVPAINPNTGEHVFKKGEYRYTLPGYRLGFTDAVKVQPTREDQARVAHYMSKYLTKDMPTFPGRKRYWHSQKLKLPLKIYHPQPIELDANITPVWESENEFGRTIIIEDAGSQEA